MNANKRKQNNLYSQQECPSCHYIFISGYDIDNIRKCPSCHKKFITGNKVDHENGYNICSNIARGGNNLYYRDNCPPLMSDGRFITNYNSSNELTENMRKTYGIRSPNEFRIFMQKNGNQLMDAERNKAVSQNTCNTNTACSEGWYDFWTINGGNWANANTV